MKKLIPVKTVLILIFFITLFPAVSYGDVIYNTFGPGDSVSGSGGWTIGKDIYQTNTPTFSQGDAFTPSGTFSLSSIELLAWYINGANSMAVKLMGDTTNTSGNSIPDTTNVLESWNFTGIDTYPGEKLMGVSVSHPLLESGIRYWLIAFPGESDSLFGWNYSLGTMGLHAYSINGGEYVSSVYNQGAFRISGTPASAPEPSTLLLLGSGLIGLMGLRRKFKK